jgi:hypothetical protein
MKLAIRPEWVVYGVGLAVAAVVVNQFLSGRLVSRTAESVARLPVDVFYGGAQGVFGLPDTRTGQAQSECAAAKAKGDCWAASFACPAADYLRCLREKYL